MSPIKKLSIGVQSFSKLIEEGFIYVDKTEYIYNLLMQGDYYFLSRPRRFGKSLLISTLKEIFLGNKHLFKGTFIANSSYTWHEHPVIHISFSSLSSSTATDLEQDIIRALERIAARYSIDLSRDKSIQMKLTSLVEQLSHKGKIVVLIDEYDYPMLNNIENIELAEICRDILRNFFATLKDLDDYIRFIFITGITKFSRASIFSGLNNLKDLSLDPQAARLLGYTTDEISTFFKPYLTSISEKSGKSTVEILEDVRFWYNGYQFTESQNRSDQSLKVYNPFSVLLYLSDGRLLNYWFETGTPSFLMYLIKTKEYPVFALEGAEVNINETKSYDIHDMHIVPLMWQAGYLTIESYNPETKNYKLAFPNEEVRTSFLSNFLYSLTKAKESLLSNYTVKLTQALNHNDLKKFFHILQVFFADIPYILHLPAEKYYQSIFYIILKLLGLPIQPEVQTNDGRIDAVLETSSHVFIIEFKLDESAQAALQQIEEKKYHLKYLNSGKKIILVGASFDTAKKNLQEWIAKELPA